MWRKQEEPKAPSQEVKVSTQAETVASPTPAVQPQVQLNQAPAPPSVQAPVANASPRQASSPTSHLTASIVVKGEITGREDLYVDGEVQGKIRMEDGRVTIGPNGRVVADVQAREIVVRGTVKGNLQGKDRLQIGPSGHATGDIVTRLISIEEGAEVHSKIEILRPAEESRAATKRAPSDSEAPVPVALQAKSSSR